MKGKILGLLAVTLWAVPLPSTAITLDANSTANNGGSSGWAMFFDLGASQSLTVTHLTTASTSTAGGAFTIEIFTRTGTALGGPVTSGPGSSTSGWTSLGTAAATQGAVDSGISLLIDIPDISVLQGQLTGVAILFTGAGPRYFGTGATPYQVFSDSYLTLTTGESRSSPFTTTGSLFASRGLTGSLTYELGTSQVPEPGSLALLGLGLAGLGLTRRRKAA